MIIANEHSIEKYRYRYTIQKQPASKCKILASSTTLKYQNIFFNSYRFGVIYIEQSLATYFLMKYKEFNIIYLFFFLSYKYILYTFTKMFCMKRNQLQFSFPSFGSDRATFFNGSVQIWSLLCAACASPLLFTLGSEIG